ncbi:MAG: SDR family NAD(P)-dependent oxidoreductase [Atopobiaceae bacterium]|jgi:short-subunit dehydrogenase|nr:SDR family NAD(P)-dependent oxidoreductase [Atopobiaceae bacterium]MCI2050939.1 SDR family NAD(P)-dependent oxidoreductase [Atopobiaceae bacterium]
MKNTALITGSYGGLGTCFVNIHAGKGGDLILVGRNQKKLDAQADEVHKKYGVEARTIAVDLSKPEAAQTIYDECKQMDILPDILINNAGFGGQGDFARERTMDQDMSMIAVNVETPTRILKLFLPDMIRRGSGKVLNVSSTATAMPGPLQAVYYATKAYMTSFSNALWRELKDTGVTLTCLMPGAMQTGFVNAGGLGDTALFAKATDPTPVAQAGYDGMLKGELNVTAGLVGAQKAFLPLSPLMPKKMLMDNVYNMQIRGSANK